MTMTKRASALIISLLMLLGICGAFPARAAAADTASIKFSYSAVTVPVGKTITLKPVITGLRGPRLNWGTSDRSVATVTDSGKVKGIKEGKVTISAKISNTSLSAYVTVYVGKRVTSVKATPASVTLEPGKTQKLKITLSPSNAAYKGVTYTSSDESVATVKKGTVTAVKAGSAVITVTAADGSKKSAQVKVTVKGSTASKTAAAAQKTATTTTTTTKKITATATNGFDTKLSAFDLTKKMTVGWNLGNGLDSIGASETAWGNPVTTEAMIKDVKAMGFNSIRIPVTYHKHTDSNGNIDSKWLDRVQEVVDYAYKNGMYVVLDDHHDNSFYDIGGCVKNEATLKASRKKMQNLWKQIANRFKSYDHKLLFEVMNEPRTEGSAKEWTGGTKEERDVLAVLTQDCVDAIRATGGNNAYRFVVCPAYAATSNTSILKGTKFPDDDRVIVDIHTYAPYNFAMNGKGPATFTDSDKSEIDRFYSTINDIFISKGRAVIIGENGAVNKNNEDERCAWAEYTIKAAKKYGIPNFIWDNNSNGTGDEAFGLYDRANGKWYWEKLAKAYTSAAK